MVQIITDSSSLFTAKEEQETGVISIPLCISIGNKNFRDLEVSVDEFVADIQAGNIPVSSQPPLGDVMDAYASCKGSPIINISMADGLSGTYQTACMARESADNREDITVINTRTLCGPHRYMVQRAAAMAKEGKKKDEIVQMLEEKIRQTKSYLIPQDFEFLRRGGRLSPAVAFVGSLLDLKPILTLNEAGSSLDKFGVGRTMKRAAKAVFRQMKKDQVGKDDILYIVHGAAPKAAAQIRELALEEFPGIDVRVHLLSHVFITHGGPGCIAIQHIRK